MNATISIPMPIIARVEALEGMRVRVTWGQSLRPIGTEIIDLAPLIECFKFYRQLRNDSELFRSVHVIDDGHAIAWGEDDEIDMASTSIERVADEAMTPEEFASFVKSNKMTHAQAAAALGRSRRQIESYLNGEAPIPRVVALACYGFEARKQMTQIGTLLRGGTYGSLDTTASTLTKQTSARFAPIIISVQ